MKKWVFGCAMALVITSCDNKKFSIQGRVADADGQVLYLESLAVNGTELLDSVELDKDGRFKFKYHAPQYPEFYQLRLGQVHHTFGHRFDRNIEPLGECGRFCQ